MKKEIMAAAQSVKAVRRVKWPGEGLRKTVLSYGTSTQKLSSPLRGGELEVLGKR